MAYKFYIDPSVNCVFVLHYGEFHVDDPIQQYKEMLEHPQYLPDMNVLRDVLTTSLPVEYGFKFFSDRTTERYKNIEPHMGDCKVAWVLGTGKDYATMHQYNLTTRFGPLLRIERKPFRTIEDAKVWLDVPADFEINYDASDA
mgnify:CR=1 FL=1|tara:strand:+ start:2601 stop:3029 length:429 start_codon:yes stop_codon:yes gene_type:complete